MEYFAGIDVSLELSSVCVVDGVGKIVPRQRWPAIQKPWLGSSAGWRLG